MRYEARFRWIAIVFLTFFLCEAHKAYSQRPSTTTLVPYDNFNSNFLDPSKWAVTYNYFGWSALECVREIRNNSLRLEARSFGTTDSNNGNGLGNSELHFINPAPIRTIAAQLTVRRATVSSCPVNTDTQAAQTLLQGTFFNSGSGNPDDDVQAFLDIEHYAGEPVGQLDATGFLHWQGQFFGGVWLGNLKVTQRVLAKLSWDQPNRQFVVSWTDIDSGQITQAVMPYSMSDTTQAAAPDKVLAVRAFAPNCVGSSIPSALVETTFDNVWIRK